MLLKIIQAGEKTFHGSIANPAFFLVSRVFWLIPRSLAIFAADLSPFRTSFTV
ncbi:MAG: hypothetical protein MJY99_06805 [Fibrobacter sp.]|nr:hypothetical protein [Fibrobacter sp.]